MGTVEVSHGPITTKNTLDKSTSMLRYGICEMQGWRRTMEDATMAIADFDKKNSYLFGVMDGHGGPIISRFVAFNFKDILVNMNSFKNHNYEQALIETYLKLDECLNNPQVNDFLYEMNYQNGEETQEENTINNELYDNIYPEIKDNSKLTKIKFKDKSIYVDLMNNNIEDEGNKFKVAKEMGTTANIIMIINNTLYLANCGDSVSVMFKNGQAIKLSQEHKTTLKSEYDRIVKSGGHILNNRIEGKLNLTRAIGDLAFKNNKNLKFYDQSVTSYPEINKIKNLEGIEFIIMGCDGLWDCVKPQKLCESISKKLKQGDSIEDFKLSDIIGDIFDQILSKTNNTPIGTDNMSCIIIEFLQNRNKKIKVTELNN